MKSNREMRDEAWRLMWKGRWFGRCVVGGLALVMIAAAVSAAVSFAYRALDIETLKEYAQAQQQAAAAGLDYSASSGEAMAKMFLASLFESFVQYLFSGILMFGVVTLTLKAVRGSRERWFAEAFAGFHAPFTMFWLMFNVQIRLAFWIVLAAIPIGVVAGVLGNPVLAGMGVAFLITLVLTWLIYRYRQVWFLKVDHPDWGAAKCIRGSIEMMNGWKWRAVQFDCSYWLSLLWSIPLLAAAGWFGVRIWQEGVESLSAGDLALLVSLGAVSVIYGLIVGWYLSIGHAVFYRELSSEKPVFACACA